MNDRNGRYCGLVSQCYSPLFYDGSWSGKEETSRSPPPLRTERATFTALGSSLDKAP